MKLKKWCPYCGHNDWTMGSDGKNKIKTCQHCGAILRIKDEWVFVSTLPEFDKKFLGICGYKNAVFMETEAEEKLKNILKHSIFKKRVLRIVEKMEKWYRERNEDVEKEIFHLRRRKNEQPIYQ